MKLNNRRTILVGLAFLSICTFWQMYDSVMTLILTDTFKLNETFAGAIMAADNVLALFLLPFFGALSDKTSTRIGRRMPFIVGGTALAAILMNLIPLLDDRYAEQEYGVCTKKENTGLAELVDGVVTGLKDSGKLAEMIKEWGIE